VNLFAGIALLHSASDDPLLPIWFVREAVQIWIETVVPHTEALIARIRITTDTSLAKSKKECGAAPASGHPPAVDQSRWMTVPMLSVIRPHP
jgi:hypothetical protein